MIDFFRSIWYSLFGVLRWFSSTISTLIIQAKVLNKIYLFLGDFMYLIPGFLAWFAVIFMIIFIVNRLTVGRN